jgi:hypothetical protein
MYVGSAYYPERLSKERIDKDASLMQEAHLNLVRIGDFYGALWIQKWKFISLDRRCTSYLEKKGVPTCVHSTAAFQWCVMRSELCKKRAGSAEGLGVGVMLVLIMIVSSYCVVSLVN